MMKCAGSLAIAFATLLTLGCARPQKLVLAPVGPAPRVLQQLSTNGTLVVFSAWQRTGTDDPEHPRHTNYDVFTEDGRRLLHVINYISPMLDDPAVIQLPPGRYVVNARVQGYGVVSVPVIIASNRSTELYLDDTTRPPLAPNETARRVLLPDGRFVGWAGAATNK